MTFTLPQEAYVARSLLEAEGILTFLKDEMTVQIHNFYSNTIGGVKLQVPERDVDNALKLLAEGGYLEAPGPDGESPAVTKSEEWFPPEYAGSCPYCRSRNVTRESRLFMKYYHCFDCGRDWKVK